VKTRGEIEAAVSAGVECFALEHTGRGPKGVHAHLVGDLLVVRLQGVLTAAEQRLTRSVLGEKGRGLLKQVRAQLVETARPLLAVMIEDVTGGKVVSLHHDLGTVTGEEVLLFTLDNAPPVREGKDQ